MVQVVTPPYSVRETETTSTQRHHTHEHTGPRRKAHSVTSCHLAAKLTHFCHQNMPAYTATANKNTSRRTPYTVPARNESTGLIERISVSAETRMKFKDIGKPRKVVKPKNVPLIKRITTPECNETRYSPKVVVEKWSCKKVEIEMC